LEGNPDQALYTFDGKPCGVGKAGLEALKAKDLPRGSTVRIREPWVYEAAGPDFMPPYAGSGLLEHWHDLGIRVEIEERWAGEDSPRITQLEP